MKAFNKLQFVLDAVSDDTTRYYINKAYYEKDTGILVATDMRRCHFWTMNEAEIKKYDLDIIESSSYVDIIPKLDKIIPCKLEAQFPNWKKVTPEKQSHTTELLYTKKTFASMVPIFMANNHIAINLDYMKSLCDGEWNYALNEEEPSSKAVRFDGSKGYSTEGLTAIIMPMRLE
jgi:hypothetical protein